MFKVASLQEQDHEVVEQRPNVRQFRLRLTYDTVPETVKYVDLNDNSNFFELTGDLGFTKTNTYYTYANYASVVDTAISNNNIQGNLYFGYNSSVKKLIRTIRTSLKKSYQQIIFNWNTGMLMMSIIGILTL